MNVWFQSLFHQILFRIIILIDCNFLIIEHMHSNLNGHIHQHFTSRFIIPKYFVQLFSFCDIFFVRKNIGLKCDHLMLVKMTLEVTVNTCSMARFLSSHIALRQVGQWCRRGKQSMQTWISKKLTNVSYIAKNQGGNSQSFLRKFWIFFLTLGLKTLRL